MTSTQTFYKISIYLPVRQSNSIQILYYVLCSEDIVYQYSSRCWLRDWQNNIFFSSTSRSDIYNIMQTLKKRKKNVFLCKLWDFLEFIFAIPSFFAYSNADLIWLCDLQFGPFDLICWCSFSFFINSQTEFH